MPIYWAVSQAELWPIKLDFADWRGLRYIGAGMFLMGERDPDHMGLVVSCDNCAEELDTGIDTPPSALAGEKRVKCPFCETIFTFDQYDVIGRD